MFIDPPQIYAHKSALNNGNFVIEEEIISTIISLATILLSTYKSPVTLTSPSISISPSNDEDTLTKNPVFGAIDADAEPLIN